jgi:hypothetical protein
MNRYLIQVGSLLIIGAMSLAACGEPEVSSPDALKVVFLPLDGAGGVDVSTEPNIYFSDDVLESSLGAGAVFLQSATRTCETNEDDVEICTCGTTWSPVEGSASLDTDNPQVAKFVPNADLTAETCYLLVFTTSVRGVTKGPLRDLGLTAERKTGLGLSPDLKAGAIQSFSTGS